MNETFSILLLVCFNHCKVKAIQHVCPVCSRTFAKTWALRAHARMFHRKGHGDDAVRATANEVLEDLDMSDLLQWKKRSNRAPSAGRSSST